MLSVSKPSSVLQVFPSSANTDLTQTPMLRQRLLDPPRLSPLQASPSLLPVGGAITSSHSAIQSSPVSSPAMSKSKALLHAKLQPKLQQSPLAQQSWPQSTQQTVVSTSGAILQVSPGGRNNVIFTQPIITASPQQNLPFVIEGITVDSLEASNKPIETKMIKNLLAKKLRPQTTPVPICPKISEPSSNPMQLLTFTEHQRTMIQGHIQNQPIIPQVIPIIQQPPPPPPRPTTPKAEKTPKKQQVESSQKPQTPVSESKKKTRSSVRVSSPKGSSPKRSTSPRTHSPKSPKTYDLDVCGKIERAKDLVQIGIEAKIEHLENKSVPKSESLSDPSSSHPAAESKSGIVSDTENQNNSSAVLSDSAVFPESTIVSSTSSKVIINNTHLSCNSSCVDNDMSSDMFEDQSEKASLSLEQSNSSQINSSYPPSSINNDCDNDIVKTNGDDFDLISSGEKNCVQVNGNSCLNGIETDLNSNSENSLNSANCHVGDKLKNENCSNMVTMNGDMGSPEVIIPSPTGDMNGSDLIEDNYQKSLELKQAISKIVDKDINQIIDKVGKLNGAINHNLGDYTEHNGENTMINGSEVMECDETTVRVVDANGEEVILRTDGVDLVVREGDQLIIDSQGTIEINGMKEPMEGIQENPIVMNETAPVIPSQTSDMEVIDAVNSILEPEPQEAQPEQTYIDNTSRCYELVGEPSEGETDTDEVIIENEMMLQPSKPSPNDNLQSEPSNDEAIVYQDDGSATDSAPEIVDEIVPTVVIDEQPLIPISSVDQNQTVVIINTEPVVEPVTINESPREKREPKIKPVHLTDTEEVRMRITNEICTTRHVPTPESSRDNELSCDSFASSNTDSDKHSMPSPVASTTQSGHFNINIIHSTGNPKPVPSSRVKSVEKKSKKRSRSGSGDSRSSSTTTVIALEYMCEWSGCKR